MRGRASRPMMDQVEMELLGHIAGLNADGSLNQREARDWLCQSCHGDEWREVSCGGEDGREWKRHLSEGRVAQAVWEAVSMVRTGTTCGNGPIPQRSFGPYTRGVEVGAPSAPRPLHLTVTSGPWCRPSPSR